MPCSIRLIAVIIVSLCAAASLSAQVAISGRVWGPIVPGSDQLYPYMTVLTFATPYGSEGESMAARTWETYPSGWHILSGNAGAYTFGVVGPGHFMRPLIITNQFMAHGDTFDRHVAPNVWYGVMKEQAWDPEPTEGYLQTFVARGSSVTNVGFKLAHDGVDGGGPLEQEFLVSIHKVSDAEPTAWKQIGPAVPVLNVNAGGVLNIRYAACWNSGEVPTDYGQLYAVYIRPAEGGGFQGYWHDDVYVGGACYRIVDGKATSTDKDLWCFVSGDGDGLYIPYNKRVQQEFAGLTKWGPKWVQTYKAMGQGLASVTLYAAVSTEQRPLRLQRVWIRVRKGGPEGPVIGTSKIAVGCNTATAESGNIGAVFAPGEVNLEPDATYAIEFEAFGTHRGFNPWMKQPRDPYASGTAWFEGTRKMDYNLDMIVVEYTHRAAEDWTTKVLEQSLLHNGDMQEGNLDSEDRDAGTPDDWERFVIDPDTTHWYVTDTSRPDNRLASIVGGSLNGKTVDGGYVQRVDDLKRTETYRLSGRVRSTWPVDEKHQVMVGLDPTGQTEDPEAATIRYTILPKAHGIFETYVSDPRRPVEDAISVWLRARTTSTHHQPFAVDFDDFAMKQVETGVPR